MRKRLRKSDIRDLNEKVEQYGFEFGKKDNVELTDELVLLDEKPVLFICNDNYVPVLKILLEGKAKIKSITVDMGAIKFVTGGADIMRPGIVACDEGKKGDFFVVIDETHKKPLAIGQLMLDSDELLTQTTGKVVKNLHYVGDDIWNF